MRAHFNDRDNKASGFFGRRHAVLDEDFWAYARHQELPTACNRAAGDYAGEWDPDHEANCPKCVKLLARYGVSV